MRLEQGQFKSAADRALACIVEAETELAGQTLDDASFARAAGKFQELRMILDGALVFSELAARLQAFEASYQILPLSKEAVQVGSRFLAICKRALLAGGAPSASLEGVFQGLIRVCQAMASKYQTPPEEDARENPQDALSKEIRAEEQRYRAEFLEDGGKNFHSLEQLTAEFAHTRDLNLLKEIFRFFHTIKGNASMLGLDSMASFAHKVEDTLVGILERNGAVTDDEIGYLIEGAKRLSQARKLLLATETKLDADGVGGRTEAQVPVRLKKFLPAKSGLARFVFDCVDVVSVVPIDRTIASLARYESPRGEVPVIELARNESPAFGVWVRPAGSAAPGLVIAVDEIERIFEAESSPENIETEAKLRKAAGSPAGASR